MGDVNLKGELASCAEDSVKWYDTWRAIQLKWCRLELAKYQWVKSHTVHHLFESSTPT